MEVGPARSWRTCCTASASASRPRSSWAAPI